MLGAFAREAERLTLSDKLAARLVGRAPQTLYSWRASDRRMRRTSARVMSTATRVMQGYRGTELAALRKQLASGELREYFVLVQRLEHALRQ